MNGPQFYTEEEFDHFEQMGRQYEEQEHRKRAVYVPALLRSQAEECLLLSEFSPAERTGLIRLRPAVQAGYYN